VPASALGEQQLPETQKTLTLREIFAETIRSESRSHEPGEIVPIALRERAFQRFEDLPIPGGRAGRGWKHDYATIGRTLAARGKGLTGERALDQKRLEAAVEITMCDALVRAEPSGRIGELVAAGLYVSSLRELSNSARELFVESFGRAVRWEDDKFAALAVALADGGVMIRVPAGMRIPEPLLIAHGASLNLDFPYVLVILEDGAEATIVEEVSGAPAFGCGIVEVALGERARLDYVVAQRRGPHSMLFMSRGAVCARDATCRWSVAEMGGGLSRSVVTTRLEGAGASAELDGFFFTDGDQHVDLTTSVDHAAGSTTSRTTVKSAATDTGQGRYLGNIRIAPHATGSDATLRDDVLLLSKGAHIDSIPALEIASNDVKAFHGATIGSIDQDELFYAESRGIARPDAERMIALGFFNPVIARFPNAAVRELLTSALAAKLGAAEHVESAL